MQAPALRGRRAFRLVFSLTALLALCYFIFTAFTGHPPANPLSGASGHISNSTAEPVSIIREAWSHYYTLARSLLYAEFEHFGLPSTGLRVYEKNMQSFQEQLESSLQEAQDVSCAEPVKRLKDLWSDKLTHVEERCKNDKVEVETLVDEARRAADERWEVCKNDLNDENCSGDIKEQLIDLSNRYHHDVKSEREFDLNKEHFRFWKDRDGMFVDELERMQKEMLKPDAVPKELRPGVGPRPEQILILTGSDYSDSTTFRWELNQRVFKNRQEYCDAHGYIHEFVNFTRYAPARDHVEHPVWFKLPAIAETFHRYPDVEWIWWLDLDALIMNGGLRLEEHLLHPDVLKERIMYKRPVASIEALYSLGGTAPDRDEIQVEDVNFIISHDWLTLNAGSFFVRRTAFTDVALQMWSDRAYIYDFEGERVFERREQDAFVHMWFNHDAIKRRTAIVPQRLINSFMSDGRWESDWTMIYEKGDFLLHFAGFNNDEEFTDKFYEVWPMVTPAPGKAVEPLPPRPEPEVSEENESFEEEL